jgi:prolipoprotein diacylglyceryl transferase
VTILASIPSPTTAVWHLGWLPIRAYALCIIVGILVACYTTERRMRRRGAPANVILDIAVWAVPFGIIGARVYHVITSPELYFDKGQDWVKMFYIWEGGLGIWGAVIGGAIGAWLACRSLRIPLTFVADALAPGLPLAQGIGRLGNWFNNELYGRRTTLPWGLQVHQMSDQDQGKAVIGPDGQAVTLPGLYHPTFLYELIWDLGTALLVFLADRKFKFGKGRAFALYVMAYTAGRFWIEYLRIDEANHFLGLRLNDWTALILFLAALIYFVMVKGPFSRIVPTADGGYRIAVNDEDQGDAPAAGDDDDATAGTAATGPAGDGGGGDDDDGGGGGGSTAAGAESADDPAHTGKK